MLIVMCLFLMLLTVISPLCMHLFWMICHGGCLAALFRVEYLQPELLPNTYVDEF
jgi:hypothetical protein